MRQPSRRCNARGPRRVFILRRSVMGVVDEQVDAVGQFEGRSPVRVIEVLHVRDVGHRAVAVIARPGLWSPLGRLASGVGAGDAPAGR